MLWPCLIWVWMSSPSVLLQDQASSDAGRLVKLFHLYVEGRPAPPMTSSMYVFHLGMFRSVGAVA